MCLQCLLQLGNVVLKQSSRFVRLCDDVNLEFTAIEAEADPDATQLRWVQVQNRLVTIFVKIRGNASCDLLKYRSYGKRSLRLQRRRLLRGGGDTVWRWRCQTFQFPAMFV